jgi:hypothetical protein
MLSEATVSAEHSIAWFSDQQINGNDDGIKSGLELQFQNLPAGTKEYYNKQLKEWPIYGGEI